MAEVLAKQLQLKRSIERAVENLRKIGKQNITAGKVRSRIAILKENWNQFMDGHAALLKATPEASRNAVEYFRDNFYEDTENAFETAHDVMTEALEDFEPHVSHYRATGASHARAPAFSLAHLPPIRLPPFEGRYEEWEHFRDRFTTLILNNKDLDDFARMHFLTSCVKGRALDCITSLSITADNFEAAWQTLVARYENKRRLLRQHLSTLLTLKPSARESVSELQSLHDRVNLAIASLHTLNRSPEQLWDDTLVHIVSQSLDPVTRKAWKLKTSEYADPPTFDALNTFIAARARALEEFAGCTSSLVTPKPASSRVHAANATTSRSAGCPICNGRHYFSACPTFTRESPARRRDLVRQYRRCFNCLSQAHSVNACQSKHSCRVCQQRHHSLLHPGTDAASNSAPMLAPPTRDLPATDSSTELLSMHAAAPRRSPAQVLLATAWVQIAVPSGRTVVIRALLDQGSQVSFISENVAQLLRAPRTRVSVSISAVGGVHAGTARSMTRISVSPRGATSPSFATDAVILKALTLYAPKRITTLSDFPHLAGLSWADSDPTSHAPIHLIIGSDLYNEVTFAERRQGHSGQPTAQNSIFGWFLSGPLGNLSDDRALDRVVVHHCCDASSLDAEIKRFWEIEEIPTASVLTAEEKQCEAHFQSTHSRAPNGRYIVRLPFRAGPPIKIGDSRARALTQLESLTKRLTKSPAHSKEYADFLADYEKLGHMRRVSPSIAPGSQAVYIPHHPVLREHSATTRLRVVFNASSRTSSGSSLNDHLLPGLKLQTELPSVLMSWRRYKFVYTADIEKMYRQIQVDPRDVDYQRILWKRSASDLVSDYQLLTVTYGTACAPFLALRVLQQLVADDGARFPLAVPLLRDNIYVDDLLFGADDTAQLLLIRDQLVALLQRGGFRLRKWASSSPDLLADIDADDHGLACTRSLHSDENVKILGIGWNPTRDCFEVKVSVRDAYPETKRSILSTIAKIYDPLGWVTPLVITAKILMQQLWRERLGWDDQLPGHLRDRWQLILAGLSCLQSFRLSRWLGVGEGVLRAELHGFADASNLAYAAVVYLRVVTRNGDITISLLAGRSKVAPLTPVSVPRLELSAAVLLARLVEFVRPSLGPMPLTCICWTDSTIVLAWLRQHPSRWQTFVSNRVADIQSRLPSAEWRHVPSPDNPADCASRGLVGGELLGHALWWGGPAWLQHDETEWPRISPSLQADAPLEERRVCVHVAQSVEVFDLASRFSSWPRLLRVTAYIFRFISRCRRLTIGCRGAADIALTSTECATARTWWLKAIQTELFNSDINTLQRKKPLSGKSPILALDPFLDQDGVLRVGGRLTNAPLSYHSRHPILLASHNLVRLIVENAHLRALHSGMQLTLSTLRREFWIIRARGFVRPILRKCVVCARERAAVPSQMMGALPAVRVTAPKRPFLHCGVDYAGPVLVRASAGRGVTTRKAYIALFVCLATRAIHLELVADYSTPAFLNAYSRFCSRRGLPQSVYSDNGTTFVGADKELTRAYRSALRDPNFRNTTATDNVAWHFIPPSAPHFGGIWEAGVRSVKYHLRRVLGRATLTFEEFATLLCQVEACLNSRPIAPLTDTLDDYAPLTPGHFLIGSAITTPPEPSLLDVTENRLTRWQLVRRLTETFWKIWYHDYVNTLQQRSKWRQSQSSIKLHQLVLVRNSSLPPCKWELGRVTACHPGSDGLTRVVTVKTASSEYKRPIVKLCILPVDCASTTDQSLPARI